MTNQNHYLLHHHQIKHKKNFISFLKSLKFCFIIFSCFEFLETNRLCQRSKLNCNLGDNSIEILMSSFHSTELTAIIITIMNRDNIFIYRNYANELQKN